MPTPNEIDHARKTGLFQLHGGREDTLLPGEMVWNTYGSATGSAVSISPGVSTLVVAANPNRKRLIIAHNAPTGTIYFWLGEGHPAAVNRGLGPMTAFGSNVTYNGVFGIYTGPIYAIHNGAGPATLTWEEGW